MNAKHAKALRRQVYGDSSLKVERRYMMTRGGQWSKGMIFNDPASLRAQYQRAKKRGE